MKENEIKSPYDLTETLWFILPGATLLICIFLFEYSLKSYIVKDEIEVKSLDTLTGFFKELDTISFYKKSKTKSLDSMEYQRKLWFVEKLREIPFEKSDNSEYVVKVKDTLIHKYIFNISNNSLESLKLSTFTLNTYIKNQKRQIRTPVYSALLVSRVNDSVFKDNWFLTAIYLLAILSLCYVIGHIMYMLATFIYERGLIMKAYNYPYERILNLSTRERYEDLSYKTIKNRLTFLNIDSKKRASLLLNEYLTKLCGYQDITNKQVKDVLNEIDNINSEYKKSSGPSIDLIEDLRKGYFRGTYFWGYVILISIYLSYIWCPKSYEFFILLPALALFIIITIVANYTVKNETFSLWKVYFFIKIYPGLINFFGRLLNRFIHTQRELDESFITKYSEATKSIYGLTKDELKKNNYWLAKLYVTENSNYLNNQVGYWEKIYKFSKSLSASFGVAAIYCAVSILLQEHTIRNVGAFYEYTISSAHKLPLIYLFLNLITLQYYFYIYDNRYSRIIFRSFVTIFCSRNQNNKK